MTPPPTARIIERLSPLPRSFYARDPRLVARELLGKLLIRRALPPGTASGGPHPPSFGECGREILIAGRIVEAEAYLGASDPGAHSYHGLTPRNAVLFGPPGHAYVYFIYGTHYCTNVSCHPPGCGVLLRALEPVFGLDQMCCLRGIAALANPSPALAAGGPERPQPERRRLPRTRLRSSLGPSQSRNRVPGSTPTLSQLRQLTSGPGRLSQALGITRQRDNGCDLCSRSSGLYIADDGLPVAAISTTGRINVTRAPHDQWRFILTGNPFVSGKKS